MISKHVSYRLSEQWHDLLTDMCKREKRTISQMSALIVEQFLKFSGQKSKRGEITMSRQSIKRRHDSIKKTDIPRIAKEDTIYIITEMKKQVESLDFDEVLRRTVEWNEENKLSFRVEYTGNHIKCTQIHDLGQRWSELQCRIYCKMFETVKGTVISKDWSETMFSFEVAKTD